VDASLGASCSFSIRRNRRRAIAKGMGMVRRALLRLARGNAGEGATPARRPPPGCRPRPPPPRVSRRCCSGGVRSALKALHRDQWGIALALGEGICLDPARARLIYPPADRFWADPMVWPAEGGGWWVFIEEVIYREGKGTLQAIRCTRTATGSRRCR
jgi:hypothetical protein